MHLGLIAIVVRDLESALGFYRDTLGLPLVSEDFVARFDLDGVRIELVPTPSGAVNSGNANARICFSVNNLEETLELLHARGVLTRSRVGLRASGPARPGAGALPLSREG